MEDKIRLIDPPSGDAMSIAKYIIGALSLVKDENTHIDTGGGFSSRDLWVKVDGKEFFISVKERQ